MARLSQAGEEESMDGRIKRVNARALAAFTLAAALGALALIAFAPRASASTTWLCKPGATPNPCFSSLQTTVFSSAGDSHVENPPLARRPKVDCFYVYPTVSEDKGTNADLSIDAEEIAVARYQASRFSQRCRVFAPMYRQLTLEGINGPPAPESAILTAYSDVRAAWKEYMRRYNHGRGVILIGHSQGTGMLTQLIRQRIDPYPSARKRLVSAFLLAAM